WDCPGLSPFLPQPLAQLTALRSSVAAGNVAAEPRRLRTRCSRSPMGPLAKLHDAMAEVDAFYKERGIFQARCGVGQQPALVIIDRAYGWTDAAYAGGSARLDSAIAAIQQLLPVARAQNVPVIYTTFPLHGGDPFKSAADYSPRFRPWDRRACEI